LTEPLGPRTSSVTYDIDNCG